MTSTRLWEIYSSLLDMAAQMCTLRAYLAWGFRTRSLSILTLMVWAWRVNWTELSSDQMTLSKVSFSSWHICRLHPQAVRSPVMWTVTWPETGLTRDRGKVLSRDWEGVYHVKPAWPIMRVLDLWPLTLTLRTLRVTSLVVQAHDPFHAIIRMTEILSDKYTNDAIMQIHRE